MQERDLIIKFLMNSWTYEEISDIRKEEKNLRALDTKIEEIFRSKIGNMGDKVRLEEGVLRYLDKDQKPNKHRLRNGYAELVFIKKQIPGNEYNPLSSNILYFKKGDMFVFIGFEWRSIEQGKSPKFVRLEKPLSYEEFSELRTQLKTEEGKAFVYFDLKISKEFPLKDFSEERALKDFEMFLKKLVEEQGERTYLKQIVEDVEQILEVDRVEEEDLITGKKKTRLLTESERTVLVKKFKFVESKLREKILSEINKYSNQKPLIGFEITFDGDIIQYQLPNKRSDTLVVRLTQYNEKSEIILKYLGI